MSWLFYAVICALAYGTEGVYVKGILRKEINEYLIVWGMFLFALPWVFILAFLKGFPPLNATFWFACLGAVAGNAFGFTFYVKAIKYTDVSLAVPLLSLSPVLLLFTSFIMLEEVPSLPGILGVVLVTIGCYLLPGTEERGFLSPFRMIGSDKGCRYAIVTVLVWSMVANIDKIALLHSSPYVYPFITTVLFSLIFLPAVWPWRRDMRNVSVQKKLAGIGFIHAVLLISHMLALQLTLVPYLIAVKRSGMLLSVLLGWILLKERKGGGRILPSAIILCGLGLIILF